MTSGLLGFGTYEYNSSHVKQREELQFLPSHQPTGDLGLKDGYLLTVCGECEGWTVCDGDLGQEVVSIISLRCCFDIVEGFTNRM